MCLATYLEASRIWKKPHGHLHSGSTSLVEYCSVILKFAQAPLRLDRIVIQLFVMLGHYLQVFFLLFLVEKEQSLSQAIFGIQNLRQTVSRNCFERKERDSCRRDPCTFTFVALPSQHLHSRSMVRFAWGPFDKLVIFVRNEWASSMQMIGLVLPVVKWLNRPLLDASSITKVFVYFGLDMFHDGIDTS